jgi:hypothetical protein
VSSSPSMAVLMVMMIADATSVVRIKNGEN